ncbi:MAG TPA: hypothetical protein VF551_00415, partial [Chthoniobacterales bacterium]
MQRFSWRNIGSSRALLLGATAALLFSSLADADARTRRRRSAMRDALAPLLLARSIVHAAADPIVHHAPHIVAAVATAPIRLARNSPERIYRGVAVDEDELDDAADEETREPEAPVRRAELVGSEQPVRVAYVVPRTRSAPPPEEADAESDDDADEAESDEPAAVERSGSKPTVAGRRAVLRNGIAYAPSQAPQNVKNAIWAANALRRKPYVWGGGHGSFYDRGYDCSGTVSFALHGAGALASPLPSSDFMRFGERG